MWLRGEIVFAWLMDDVMVEVRQSPTCAFLSCRAGREVKCVFYRRRSLSVRYIHGSAAEAEAEAEASWSPLLL